MVIYEVNLTVNNDIFQEYYHWLVPHVEMILQFRGFKKARISKEKIAEDNISTTKLTVQYTLDTEENLDAYLKNHSPAMREDGIKRFGDKFSATRRVFVESSVMEPK